MEKRKPCALLVGMQTGAATVENSMKFLKNLKIEFPFDPVIPLLRIYPDNPKHQAERIYAPLCSQQFYNSQDLERAQVTINKWVDKQILVHLQNGILYSCLLYTSDAADEHRDV